MPIQWPGNPLLPELHGCVADHTTSEIFCNFENTIQTVLHNTCLFLLFAKIINPLKQMKYRQFKGQYEGLQYFS